MTVTMHDVARGLKAFDHEGVTFWDLNSIMHDGQKWRRLIDDLATTCEGRDIDMIVSLDARGFLIAGALAYKLGIGKIMSRKQGKLPGKTIGASYGLEYRDRDILELQDLDYIKPGMNVLIVDDVLATGGTAFAAASLVERLEAKVTGIMVAIELPFLNGRAKLCDYPVYSALSIIDGTPTAEVEYCIDVIPERTDGEFVMINRLTDPSGLAFPGGRIELWETSLHALHRELMEETALATLEPRFLETLCGRNRDPRGDKVSLLYRAKVSGAAKGEKGKTEIKSATPEEWAKVVPDEFAFDAHGVLTRHVLSEAA